MEIKDPKTKHEMMRYYLKEVLPQNVIDFVVYYYDKHNLHIKSNKLYNTMKRFGIITFVDIEFGYVPRVKFYKLLKRNSHTDIVYAVRKGRQLYFNEDAVFIKFYNEIKKEYEEFKTSLQKNN